MPLINSIAIIESQWRLVFDRLNAGSSSGAQAGKAPPEDPAGRYWSCHCLKELTDPNRNVETFRSRMSILEAEYNAQARIKDRGFYRLPQIELRRKYQDKCGIPIVLAHQESNADDRSMEMRTNLQACGLHTSSSRQRQWNVGRTGLVRAGRLRLFKMESVLGTVSLDKQHW